jgi:hypothetical protein
VILYEFLEMRLKVNDEAECGEVNIASVEGRGAPMMRLFSPREGHQTLGENVGDANVDRGKEIRPLGDAPSRLRGLIHPCGLSGSLGEPDHQGGWSPV